MFHEIRSETQNLLSFWAIILPFYHPLTIPIIKILKKMKKCLDILSFYTYMCTINEDHMIYGSWNTRYNRQFLSFWTIFCPFSLLTNWKIKILKLKKIPGDLIILHICTINGSHMMYGSWDMEHHREFFVILDRFLPFVFYPMNPENQNFEKMKKTSEDLIILQMCTINDSHMMYHSRDMECNRQNFLSFWTVFCSFTPLTTRKIKILKKWKKKAAWRYYHFTQVYHKRQSYDVWFLRYQVWQCMVPEIWTVMDSIFCHFGPFSALLPS